MSAQEMIEPGQARLAIGQPSTKGLSNTMKMIRCKELFTEFYVDPTLAKRNIPPNYEVRIHDNGKAILLLMVQDCEKCILNGFIPISPMRMSHIWIEIVGPENTGPILPGTSTSLPTRYYYALPHQIDNTIAWFALRLVGIDVKKVRLITLGGDPGGNRQGKVIENDQPNCRYTWEEKSVLWPSPNVVTGRRWFYREYGRIVKRRSEGLVVCHSSFLGESEVSLDAGIDSEIGRLGFGMTLIGTANPVKMDHCDVNIQVILR
jgi:hypothetical protein